MILIPLSPEQTTKYPKSPQTASKSVSSILSLVSRILTSLIFRMRLLHWKLLGDVLQVLAKRPNLSKILSQVWSLFLLNYLDNTGAKVHYECRECVGYNIDLYQTLAAKMNELCKCCWDKTLLPRRSTTQSYGQALYIFTSDNRNKSWFPSHHFAAWKIRIIWEVYSARPTYSQCVCETWEVITYTLKIDLLDFPLRNFPVSLCTHPVHMWASFRVYIMLQCCTWFYCDHGKNVELGWS